MMADVKNHRQRIIADLIRKEPLSSQEDLAERLASLGFAATQATVSRDLEQIGAVKVRRAGQVSYAMPDPIQGPQDPQLATIVRDWVRSIEVAGNLVIIKAPPGSAHLVGVALDRSELAEIVGTICGDDTIFIACRTPEDGTSLSCSLRAMIRG
jgi:arginine repressor